MKFLALSLIVAGFCSAAQLKDVKSVYFYPMPGGFEQHLASQIVRNHVYQVVSDPKLADAIFTDNISDAFLYNLDHINTPAKPATLSGSVSSMTVNEAPHASSFSRGKGTLFLVDAKSKQVVWSIYKKPKNTLPATLDKTAKKVIQKLEIDNGMKTATAKQ
jgi:hypothetical protein